MSDLFAPGNMGRRLANGRRAALARMTSRCTIALPLPRSEWVEGDDGMQVPSHRRLYADLPCRLAWDTQASVVVVGDATQQAARRRLDLPHDTRVVDGAVARIDSGEWAGTFWRLPDSTGKDQATALRLVAEEVDEPEGWGTWASV